MQAALLKSTRLARAPCASLNKGARSPRHCVVSRRRLTELHVLAAVSLSCFTRTRTERVAELVALLGWAGGAVVRVRLEWLWFLFRASLARAPCALLNLLHFSSLSQLA